MRSACLPRAVLALTLLISSTSCGDTARPDSQEIDNLRAFAKLYGYARFFHPSDEAAATDWEAFAIHGAGRVRGAASRCAFRVSSFSWA